MGLGVNRERGGRDRRLGGWRADRPPNGTDRSERERWGGRLGGQSGQAGGLEPRRAAAGAMKGQSETLRNRDPQTETERQMPVGDPKRPGTPRESAGTQRCTHPGTSTEAARGKLRQRAQGGESQGEEQRETGCRQKRGSQSDADGLMDRGGSGPGGGLGVCCRSGAARGALIGCESGGRGPGGMGCRGGPGKSLGAAPLDPTLPPRCARASRSADSPLPPTLEGVSGQASGPRGLQTGLPSLLSGQPGLPGPGEGSRFWPVPPPHAPPQGPDSGVRGRTGDARPVYPPRAASAPTGGAAKAGEGEGSPLWPVTCPGCSALGL